ncbi:MAG: DegV family protein [Anaerolineae bacterium]|nr:DegV family protein [Anaerolineae bacterium]
MGKVHVVTDSSAHFLDPGVVGRYDITVVPMEIRFGDQSFKEGVNIDADEFFYRVSRGGAMPDLIPPSVEDFAEVYRQLNRKTDQIISVHRSHQLDATWQNARTASQMFLGRCDIAVIDSGTTTAGQSILVEEAACAAEIETSLEAVVRTVRGIIPRIYSVFYVETMDYIRRHRLLGEAQTILGTMLGIKPFMTIEEGELVAMEKVRTRNQATDRLVEFVTEFANIERLIILQNTPYPTDQTRMLQDRLALEFPGSEFPILMYGPSLATQIGPDGMGVVVYEGLDDSEDW